MYSLFYFFSYLHNLFMFSSLPDDSLRPIHVVTEYIIFNITPDHALFIFNLYTSIKSSFHSIFFLPIP